MAERRGAIAAILVFVRGRGRGVALVVAGMVSLVVAACGGSDGGDTTVEPAEVAAFCDTLRTSAGSSMQQSWVALRDAAPTSQLESAFESMIAMNDPEGRSHQRVNEFAQTNCDGATVRGGR